MRRGIRQDLTKEFILSKVSQEMIMAKYMGIPISVVNNCVENNELICSPLRVDNHPTFGFAFNNKHKLKARDFNGSFFGDCFDLVAYVLSFKTGRHINVANKADFYYILKHIAYTFRKIIYDGEVDEENEILLKQVISKIKASKPIIEIATRTWTNNDKNIWGKWELVYIGLILILSILLTKCILIGIVNLVLNIHIRNQTLVMLMLLDLIVTVFIISNVIFLFEIEVREKSSL